MKKIWTILCIAALILSLLVPNFAEVIEPENDQDPDVIQAKREYDDNYKYAVSGLERSDETSYANGFTRGYYHPAYDGTDHYYESAGVTQNLIDLRLDGLYDEDGHVVDNLNGDLVLEKGKTYTVKYIIDKRPDGKVTHYDMLAMNVRVNRNSHPNAFAYYTKTDSDFVMLTDKFLEGELTFIADSTGEYLIEAIGQGVACFHYEKSVPGFELDTASEAELYDVIWEHNNTSRESLGKHWRRLVIKYRLKPDAVQPSSTVAADTTASATESATEAPTVTTPAPTATTESATDAPVTTESAPDTAPEEVTTTVPEGYYIDDRGDIVPLGFYIDDDGDLIPLGFYLNENKELVPLTTAPVSTSVVLVTQQIVLTDGVPLNTLPYTAFLPNELFVGAGILVVAIGALVFKRFI